MIKKFLIYLGLLCDHEYAKEKNKKFGKYYAVAPNKKSFIKPEHYPYIEKFICSKCNTWYLKRGPYTGPDMSWTGEL